AGQPVWAEALATCAASLRAVGPRVEVTPRAELWRPGGPGWAARSAEPDVATDTGPGRRFVLGDGWELRVGRNNADNDDLTHRFAHPDDVWLHASGVPGSHVVLRMQGRRGNPPRDVLEKAAAFAARYSKAKHAGAV